MNRNHFRLKAHSRKRFKAVFESAQAIDKLMDSDQILDAFSNLEIEAYTLSMKAVFLIET